MASGKDPRLPNVGELFRRGRRLVEASAEIPEEALGFLGELHLRRRRTPPAGSQPGAFVVPPDAAETRIHVMAYEPGAFEEHRVEDLGELATLAEGPGRVVWIDVQGFADTAALERMGEILGIHPLAMADLFNVPQRPKAELYGDRLLIITQMARITEGGEIQVEQVSLVLGPRWVLSLQERPGDVFDPVRARIRTSSARIRQMGPDFLAYALLDAVIDGYFPVVEAIGGVIDALEEDVTEGPATATLARIHATRRTLLNLHRIQWSQRDAVGVMLRDEDFPFTDPVRVYLRDAHDHAIHTVDAIETYREMTVGLMDLYLSTASNRMSEVMKTLTIVATIFIPLTFIAGVYGMNFDHMPELHWRFGYLSVWAVMIAIAVGFVFWFWLRGWLQASPDRPED